MNNYLGSIYETQEYMTWLLDELREEEAPVVVLFYGDHKPMLGNSGSAYKELGMNTDPGTEEGFRNYYSTRYVIWGNEAARARLGDVFSGEGPTVSPGFLMNVLFDTLGWEGSSMIQLERRVMEKLPVITTLGWYMADGTLTPSLNSEQEELRRELEWAQYYSNHSFSAMQDRYIPRENPS